MGGAERFEHSSLQYHPRYAGEPCFPGPVLLPVTCYSLLLESSVPDVSACQGAAELVGLCNRSHDHGRCYWSRLDTQARHRQCSQQQEKGSESLSEAQPDRREVVNAKCRAGRKHRKTNPMLTGNGSAKIRTMKIPLINPRDLRQIVALY